MVSIYDSILFHFFNPSAHSVCIAPTSKLLFIFSPSFIFSINYITILSLLYVYLDGLILISFLAIIAVPFPLWMYYSYFSDIAGLFTVILWEIRGIIGGSFVHPVSSSIIISDLFMISL